MLKTGSKHCTELREFLNEVPVIETHEHYTGIIQPVKNIFGFLLDNYYRSDFIASLVESEIKINKLLNPALPFDERYSIFEEFYLKSCNTAYAYGLKEGLKDCWGIDTINKESIKNLEKKLKDRDQKFYENTMKRCGIVAKIVNMEIEGFVNKKDSGDGPDSPALYTELCRFAFPLPQYHNIHNIINVNRLGRYIGRKITTLDDYIEGFEIYLKKCIDFGIVCFKDQTAYNRIIKYTNPARAEAENAFNKIISNPRDTFGEDEVRDLNDWLFHHFMRLARKYNLPVQIHTGHMAGIRNDIEKTNAVHLTSLLEMYSDVKFDLFHGNWPYMGELLFLGKNYPNVYLDLCWVQSIDPLYSVELMKRALVTVPHTKIMAFGGDTTHPEWAAGYLSLARDNTACALSDMVDSGWISLSEAKSIAVDWFFNNPNELFRLELERGSV